MSTVRRAPKNAKTHEASLSENMAQELNERLAAGSPIRIPPRPTASIQPKRRVSAPRAVAYDIAAGVAAPVVHAAGLLARPISEDIGNSLIDTATGWRLNAQDRLTDRSLITHAAAFIGGLLVPDATDAIRVSKATKKVVDKLDDVIDAIPPKVGPRGVMTPSAKVAPSGLVPPVAPIRPIEAAPPRSRWPLGAYAEDYVQMPSPTVGPIRNPPLRPSASVQRTVGRPLGVAEMEGADVVRANNFLTPREQLAVQQVADIPYVHPGYEVLYTQPNRGSVIRPANEIVHTPTRSAYGGPLESPYNPPLQLEYKSDLYKKFDRAARAKATKAKNQAIEAENKAKALQDKIDDAERNFVRDETDYRLRTEEAAKKVAEERANVLREQRRVIGEQRSQSLQAIRDSVQAARDRGAAEAAAAEAQPSRPFRERASEFWGRAKEGPIGKTVKTAVKGGKYYLKNVHPYAGALAAGTQWLSPEFSVSRQKVNEAEAAKLAAEVDYLNNPGNPQFRDAYVNALKNRKQAEDELYFWTGLGRGLLYGVEGPVGGFMLKGDHDDRRREKEAISELQTTASQLRESFAPNAIDDLRARLTRAEQEVSSVTGGRKHFSSLAKHTAVNNVRAQILQEFARKYSDIVDPDLKRQVYEGFEQFTGEPLSSYLPQNR